MKVVTIVVNENGSCDVIGAGIENDEMIVLLTDVVKSLSKDKNVN